MMAIRRVSTTAPGDGRRAGPATARGEIGSQAKGYRTQRAPIRTLGRTEGHRNVVSLSLLSEVRGVRSRQGVNVK